MQQYTQSIKSYVSTHRDNLTTAAVIVVILAVVVALAGAALRHAAPNIVYEPASACELLTKDEAVSVLGDLTLRTTNTQPVVSGDTATSQCGYADGNPDSEAAIVAVLMVRAAINDDGVEQNSTEFAAGRPDDSIEILKHLGDGAYFDERKGQLNVLDGYNWYLISYGVGSDPAGNTVQDAETLAGWIIEPSAQALPKF